MNISDPGTAQQLQSLGVYVGFLGVITRGSYYVEKGSYKKGTAPAATQLGYPRVSVQKITDGMSKTGLICEKRLNVDKYAEHSWHDDRGWSDGWDPDTLRSCACQPRPDSASEIGQPADGLTAGAAHPGGFNMAFADGSVTTMNYEVDPELWNRVGHRSDGEPVDDERLGR
jgi:prepilin-type processing-associated H-X9-DG protein